MSGSWPPNPSQYPEQSGQEPPYQGYGSPPQQGYGGYAPPSRGYGSSEQGYGGYGPPSQSRQQGGWQGTEGAAWSRGGTSQQVPPARYPGQGGPPPGDPYGGAPYGQQYGYDYGYRNAPPPPPRRNLMLPLILGVVLVLVAAGAVGAYALTRGQQPAASGHNTTAHATATPGIPAGFKAYDDSTTHVHMILPTDWTTTGSIAGSTGLIALSPDQNSGILVKQYNFVGSNTGAANGALSGAAGSGTVTNKVGPTSVTLAGATWTQESGDISRDGTSLHMVVLVTTYNQSTYLIGYFALSSSFASANKNDFQPTVNSFTFTK